MSLGLKRLMVAVAALALPLLVQALDSGIIDLDEKYETRELGWMLERSRKLLTEEQKELLELILEADDRILEQQGRGLVDQILAGLSGGGLGILGSGSTTTTPPTNSSGGTSPRTPTTGPTNNDNYLFAQISKVVLNSGTRNVTGIVDEALKIGTPAPVRDLVNGILAVAYCNGIRRLLGRC